MKTIAASDRPRAWGCRSIQLDPAQSVVGLLLSRACVLVLEKCNSAPAEPAVCGWDAPNDC